MKSVKSQLLTDFFECALVHVQGARLAPENGPEIESFPQSKPVTMERAFQ
jgi:hypothetical protein